MVLLLCEYQNLTVILLCLSRRGALFADLKMVFVLFESSPSFAVLFGFNPTKTMAGWCFKLPLWLYIGNLLFRGEIDNFVKRLLLIFC